MDLFTRQHDQSQTRPPTGQGDAPTGDTQRLHGFWTLQQAAAHLGSTPADVRRLALQRGMRLLSIGCYPTGGYRIKASDVADLCTDRLA
jgi:hypothetical protein